MRTILFILFMIMFTVGVTTWCNYDGHLFEVEQVELNLEELE